MIGIPTSLETSLLKRVLRPRTQRHRVKTAWLHRSRTTGTKPKTRLRALGAVLRIGSLTAGPSLNSRLSLISTASQYLNHASVILFSQALDLDMKPLHKRLVRLRATRETGCTPLGQNPISKHGLMSAEFLSHSQHPEIS